jgi:small GTP-binding protein
MIIYLYNYIIMANIKILIIGESSVGKTSILRSLAGDPILPSMKPTIGVDFCHILRSIDNIEYRIYMMDTAGTEKFRAV